MTKAVKIEWIIYESELKFSHDIVTNILMTMNTLHFMEHLVKTSCQ